MYAESAFDDWRAAFLQKPLKFPQDHLIAVGNQISDKQVVLMDKCPLAPRAGNLSSYPEAGYTDWRECLRRCPSEVVCVCTVNAVTPRVVCEALSLGKHVFSPALPYTPLAQTGAPITPESISAFASITEL